MANENRDQVTKPAAQDALKALAGVRESLETQQPIDFELLQSFIRDQIELHRNAKANRMLTQDQYQLVRKLVFFDVNWNSAYTNLLNQLAPTNAEFFDGKSAP